MRYIFIFLILPLASVSQITPRNVLQKNCPTEKLKNVLVSQNDFHPFPKTPEQWKKVLPDSMAQLLIKNGEAALKENFPGIPATVTLDFTRNGDRIRYENILFGKRNRLWNLVLAESVEGKGRFTDAIIDGIWAISEESFWGTSAHLFLQQAGPGLPDVDEPVVDLFVAETAATMASVDYFMGEQLDSISPQLRKRIYYEVNRRVFIPIQTAKYEWMGFGDTKTKLNNWAPWIMSNYLTAVLFLEKDPTKRIDYVNKAIQLTDQYINGFGEDGGCEEGPHYWTFGTGCVFGILNLLNSATNGSINVFKERIIQNMGAYIYRTHISGNYFVDVADSRPEIYPEAITVWRFGKAIGDTTLSSFGAWLYRGGANNINATFHRSRTLYDLLNLADIANEQKIYHPVNDSWLPDVQLMTKRLPNGFFIAVHGGNNGESHNHNDVGDFIVYANGDPVIIDVGSGTYTSKTFSKERYNLWFNASAYHNLPTINGQQQRDGLTYAATRVNYNKGKQETVLAMNIEQAYPSEANVRSWQRVVATNNKTITIADYVEASHPITALTQTFMTVCDADISTPGIIIFTTAHGKKVTLRYGKEWSITKETMPLTTPEEQGLKTTWHNRPISRISLSLHSPASKANFKYVLDM